MDKSMEQTVEERRAYVNQIRSSFQTDQNPNHAQYSLYGTMAEEQESNLNVTSTLGLRTIIAILVFVAFIYCDKEHLTYQNYSTKNIYSQIKWNPLPISIDSLEF